MGCTASRFAEPELQAEAPVLPPLPPATEKRSEENFKYFYFKQCVDSSTSRLESSSAAVNMSSSSSAGQGSVGMGPPTSFKYGAAPHYGPVHSESPEASSLGTILLSKQDCLRLPTRPEAHQVIRDGLVKPTESFEMPFEHARPVTAKSTSYTTKKLKSNLRRHASAPDFAMHRGQSSTSGSVKSLRFSTARIEEQPARKPLQHKTSFSKKSSKDLAIHGRVQTPRAADVVVTPPRVGHHPWPPTVSGRIGSYDRLSALAGDFASDDSGSFRFTDSDRSSDLALAATHRSGRKQSPMAQGPVSSRSAQPPESVGGHSSSRSETSGVSWDHPVSFEIGPLRQSARRKSTQRSLGTHNRHSSATCDTAGRPHLQHRHDLRHFQSAQSYRNGEELSYEDGGDDLCEQPSLRLTKSVGDLGRSSQVARLRFADTTPAQHRATPSLSGTPRGILRNSSASFLAALDTTCTPTCEPRAKQGGIKGLSVRTDLPRPSGHALRKPHSATAARSTRKIATPKLLTPQHVNRRQTRPLPSTPSSTRGRTQAKQTPTPNKLAPTHAPALTSDAVQTPMYRASRLDRLLRHTQSSARRAAVHNTDAEPKQLAVRPKQAVKRRTPSRRTAQQQPGLSLTKSYHGHTALDRSRDQTAVSRHLWR